MTEPIARRLRDLDPDAGVEGQLGQLIRKLEPAPQLSPEGRQVIRGALRATTHRVKRGFSLRRPMAMALTIAAVLFVGTGIVVAGMLALRQHRAAQSRSLDTASDLRHRPTPTAATERLSAPQQPNPMQTEPLAPSAASIPAHAIRSATRRQAEPESAASPIAQESRLLASALQKLRQQNDPEGALAVVHEYRARFPNGILRAEADLIERACVRPQPQ